ncbi:Asparagine synthetase protein [Halorhabdus tiamatea SARL4B]|uniref:Asparagine synthase [glutamine-hydrolyzing] n=1 Tax=Halorhabdus tiamatea SARL4B TaxID=1033806 RepID=S6CT97_9EURY|nr:asparagine synthetase B [Halorhabdus tiamatea]ERJ07155.1 Asparagine synthetase protein [Halorhabdus tiamatea SARL4B]CCQ32777.1 asparagine synthase [glutamine-hydrolyzing] [Halorhabdus tiamatea SARL4B]
MGSGSPDGRPQVQGADPATVRRAVETGDPLPGTRGFAGRLDGRLLRDVLGRYPLFVDGDDLTSWAFEPVQLVDPVAVPAGHVQTEDGFRRRWSLPSPSPSGGSRAIDALQSALEASLEAVETDGLAIAFSGGIDSALVAARLDAPLYVAGFPGSHDVAAARDAAGFLDADLRVVELDHGALEAHVPDVVAATTRTNAMDVEIALPLFLVASAAAADGFDRLAVGQGADELFSGYAKVANASEDPRLSAETVRGARDEVLQTLPDQLERDALAIRAGGVEPVAPLLDDRVVEAALSLPDSLLISSRGDRKFALRLASREWLPDSVAFREKKALQYGSLVARELDRLARQAGFKRRMDDHVTQYVESLRG